MSEELKPCPFCPDGGKLLWDEKQHAWVCDQCGGIEPCSNDVNYCCGCGAEVIG